MAWQGIYYVVVLIISAIVSYSLRPKPPAGPTPSNLSDFDVPTAEEGKPIPVVFGTCWIKAPNVLWYGDLSTRPIKKKSGGK